MTALSMAMLAHMGYPDFSDLIYLLTYGMAALCAVTCFQTILFLRRSHSPKRYALLTFPRIVAVAAIAISFTGYWIWAFEFYARDSDVLMFSLHTFSTLSIAFSLLAPVIDWFVRHVEIRPRKAAVGASPEAESSRNEE